MKQKFSRAKSLSGLWGNYKYIAQYKTWATMIWVAKGFAAGVLVGWLL